MSSKPNLFHEVKVLKAVYTQLPAGVDANNVYTLLVEKVATLTERWSKNGWGTPAKLAEIALPSAPAGYVAPAAPAAPSS